MTLSRRNPLTLGLATALLLTAGVAPAWGQETDHASHHPAAKPTAAQSQAKPVDPRPSDHAHHATPSKPPAEPMEHGTQDHGSMDHGNMDHGAMKQGAADPAGSDHSTMDHSSMDHSGMDGSNMDHSGMDHASMGHQAGASQDLPATAEPHEPIPVVTPADRAAAFQDLDAHVMHGESINSYWSLDRLEAWDADEDGTGMAWEAKAWVGSDLNRLWLRSEGERASGSTESADVEVLYGRAIAHGGMQSPVSDMTSALAAARRALMPRSASSALPRTSLKSKPRPTWASPARSDSGRKPNTKCCSPTG